jgi:hypothetical protein
MAKGVIGIVVDEQWIADTTQLIERMPGYENCLVKPHHIGPYYCRLPNKGIVDRLVLKRKANQPIDRASDWVA